MTDLIAEAREWETNEDVPPRVKQTIRGLADALAAKEAETDARVSAFQQAAINALCPYCRNGYPVEPYEGHDTHLEGRVDRPYRTLCVAAAVRALAGEDKT